MKKQFNHIIMLAGLLAAAVTTSSCMKETPFEPSFGEDRIVFATSGIQMDVQTKVAETTVSTLQSNGFKVSATTGSAGSESSVWNNVSFTRSGSVWVGDKYWPSSNPSYHFYASNYNLTHNASGCTVAATNTTDVVCAYMPSPTYKVQNTLNFEHIFARLCRIDVAAESGYTVSGISIRITPKTGGTYNLRTGAGQTDGTGWSGLTTGSETQIASAVGANNNDIYLVPGIYSITCTWTATQSGASVTHTNQVCNVPITGGKTNNISVVLGGDVMFGVDLEDYCEYDYRDNLDYLTFYCDEAGTIGWKCRNYSVAKTIQYSKNFGSTWTNLTSTPSGATISVAAGDIVWFKGTNTSYSSTFDFNCFTFSNKVHVYGNVNSLTGNNTSVGAFCFYKLFSDCTNLYTYERKKIILPATTLGNYCYANMFYRCSNLTVAPELPATTLANYCYINMFSDCTSLTAAPELPATTLADNCYYGMFYGCTGLTTAPELPATTLASTCYYEMFKGCTSLTTAPELPATTLGTYCYMYMFQNCTGLKDAPELPVTEMKDRCYCGMFWGCSNLTKAPELPAITLASGCYEYMFYNCSSLNYIKALFTTTPSTTYTMNWVSGVAATGTFVKSEDATWDVIGNNGVPTGWMTERGTYDAKDNLNYLTFYCDEAGAIGWKCNNASIAKTIQYSKDFGASWTNLTSTTSGATIAVNAGDVVWFKGNNAAYANEAYNNEFTLSNKAHIYGNVNSLTGNNTSVSSYCFHKLFFNCSNLYTYEHKKIILPATTLANGCYSSMFYGCTSLTTAPELPATTLADGCYGSMFYGCTSLTTAPKLPATTLAIDCYAYMFGDCTSLTTAPELPATTLEDECYMEMFNGCTSLTTAPQLPATTLAYDCYMMMFFGCTSLTTAPQLPATTLAIDCYDYMFGDCTSLTTAPELPATTLEDYCYYGMFYGCTSLTTAPELPATTLAEWCYNEMFYSCTSLNYIKALFTTDPSSGSYTTDWVNGVAATGTFVKSAAATWNVTGDDGVPTGWTVKVETPGPGQWMDNPDNFLRFKFVTDGSVRWQNVKGDIQYSKNGGTTWTAFNGTTVAMSAGEEIWFKGSLTGGCGGGAENASSKFFTVGKLYASGNVQSLCSFSNTLVSNHFTYLFSKCVGLNCIPEMTLSLPAETLAQNCYQSMFQACASLTTAPALPAETLASYCYQSMFYNCASLTTAPALPAETLAQNCYQSMFYNCASLTTAPALPAETLASSCYANMFYGCASLTTAPSLPAETLANGCYNSMFYGCASLTTAPASLPAETLTTYCYNSMFYNCVSLTAAPALPATTLANSCYSNMFYCCASLTAAPALPATTLANTCYSNMFYGCASLTTAPALPAETLTSGCYQYMFYGCTSLTTAPALPAETLETYCYASMFYNCVSLTTAPASLPATTLANYCYQGMFSGCSSLTDAPALPATTLANSCYANMFQGCASLTAAPVLPATTLVNYCYRAMFQGCSRLHHIEALFLTTPSNTYTQGWVSGVAATGTFVKNDDATWNVTGTNGVPTGWTVHTVTP